MVYAFPTMEFPMMRRRFLMLSWLLLILPACAGVVRPLPADFPHPEGRAAAESLRETASRVGRRRWNPGRLAAAWERARELGTGDLSRAEWIDWWSFEENFLIEIPGKDPGILYITAHYDRTDANPLKFASLLLNGVLDEAIAWSFLSEGAVDNATGVAVALELARSIREAGMNRTYRILLAGSEESGLRGSRAHVARLTDEERGRVALAVNLDTVGLSDSPNCVMVDESSPDLAALALSSAQDLGMELGTGKIPGGAMSDADSFKNHSLGRELYISFAANLTGMFLPQRSYFSKPFSVPVLSLAGCEIVGAWDYVAGTILLPLGSLHGPRDSAARVDPVRLYEQYAIAWELVQRLDRLQTIGTP